MRLPVNQANMHPQEPIIKTDIVDGIKYNVMFDGDGFQIHVNKWDGKGLLTYRYYKRLRILEEIETGTVYSFVYYTSQSPKKGYRSRVRSCMDLIEIVIYHIKEYKVTI
jgi:hypothetical protein